MLRQLLWLLLLALATLFYTDAQSQTELGDKQDEQQQQQRVAARHNDNCDTMTMAENDEWELFKKKYIREYPNKEEETRRRELWKANVDTIAEHNRKYKQGLTTYRQAANNFTDWTDGEFERLLGARLHECDKRSSSGCNSQAADEQVQSVGGDCEYVNIDPRVYANLPSNIDWRNRGGVTDVRNQGELRTCYAFSALGALESQLLIFDYVTLNLSEQQIVDCSFPYGNQGINGGMPYSAFVFINDTGSVSEDKYLYTQTNGSCKSNQQDVVVKIGGCKRLPENNETALKAAVATYGPISVAINSLPSLKFYSEGVYSDDNCTYNYDHAVLVVGYGRTEIVGGIDYWTIKNSWGVGWGDRGYLKLARNQNSMCGVAMECVFPCGVELVCPPGFETKSNCRSRHRGGRSC